MRLSREICRRLSQSLLRRSHYINLFNHDMRSGYQVTKRRVGILLILLCVVSVGRTVCADPAGKQDYLTDCARCHGVDGKGGVPEMRAVPGYMTVDLTQLSANNAGKFPRQEVSDAIDGRKRFPAHFLGDMPAWGLKYRQDGPDGEERVRQKISALVDYVESLQTK
jgi:hypothetical protein